MRYDASTILACIGLILIVIQKEFASWALVDNLDSWRDHSIAGKLCVIEAPFDVAARIDEASLAWIDQITEVEIEIELPDWRVLKVSG